MYNDTIGVKTCTRDSLYESDDHYNILHEEKDDKCRCNGTAAII